MKNLMQIDTSAIEAVLDVGCGQGSTTEMLARVLPSAKVLGIDFSRAGIAIAQQSSMLPNLSFVTDPDSRRLDLATYDLVTCFEVLEHVGNWEPLLQRMCHASRRYVMLSFPTGRMRDFEPAVGHVRNFRRGQVEQFMDSNGYRSCNVFYAGFPFYSPLYRDLCNLVNAANSDFASGRFGVPQKVVSAVFFALFRYLSFSRLGDQFCGVFERK